MEITEPSKHKKIIVHKKHYIATSDKTLTMQWVSDIGKVIHLGVDQNKKTKLMLEREEDMRRAERASSLIKKIKVKHKKPSEIERARLFKKWKIEEEEKRREEYERTRVKTPKWMKEFSIDGLIDELTAEREAKLAETLKAQEEEEDEEEEEEEEEAQLSSVPVEMDTNPSLASSNPSTTPPPKKIRKKKPKRTKGHSHSALPYYLSDALADNYQDTLEQLYEHASAIYIQRLYRGRLQKRKFLNTLFTQKFQKCARELCYNRKRDLASREVRTATHTHTHRRCPRQLMPPPTPHPP